MSMNAEPENFDQIQRVLKLKRYEQPPPRYFNDFSGQIIARIRAGEMGRHSTLEGAAWEAPWLQRFMSALTNRPGLSGSFAVAVCAFFVGGILYSERMDVPPAGLGMTAAAEGLAPVGGGSAMPLNPAGDMALLTTSSTNPIAQPTGSLFDQIRLTAQPMPVAFPLGGGNQ